MLEKQKYDMQVVDVFVDATHEREDGSNECHCYYHKLRAAGFEGVKLRPGGERPESSVCTHLPLLCEHSRSDHHDRLGLRHCDAEM